MASRDRVSRGGVGGDGAEGGDGDQPGLVVNDEEVDDAASGGRL